MGKTIRSCDAHYNGQPCAGDAPFSNYCGAYVCMDCGAHVGLARCYCGWSASGGDGRAELVEMGETIGDEYPDSDTFFSREVPWEVEQDWDYLGDDT